MSKAHTEVITLKNLSISELQKCVKKLTAIKDKISTDLTRNVIQKVLEECQHLAEQQLKLAYPDDESRQKRNEILQAFVIENNGTVGRLKNEHAQASYIEFGIGMIGEGSPHELAGRLGYLYNVEPATPTMGSKRAFWRVNADKFESHKNNEKLLYAKSDPDDANSYLVPDAWWHKGYGLTQGHEPARFMYQAMIKVFEQGATPKWVEIYRKEVTKILKWR